MRQRDIVALGLFVAFGAAACFAQTMNVKIVKRQDGETAYSYSTAGRSDSTTETKTKCRDGYSGTKCVETTSTSTQFVPPVQGTYSVTGSTLSLQLPDGRVAVVNCTSKLSLFAPGPQTKRSCRIPPVDDIQAEFKGKNAKLSWSVSVDGTKSDSETYKILTVSN